MQHSYEGLDRPGGFSRVGLLAPLRSRDFRLLWSAMTVSLIGDGIFLIAMVWQAYALWNAPAALSVLGIGMTVPTIACLLLGGAISDRLDRRRILLYSRPRARSRRRRPRRARRSQARSFSLLVVLVALYGVGDGVLHARVRRDRPEHRAAGDLARRTRSISSCGRWRSGWSARRSADGSSRRSAAGGASRSTRRRSPRRQRIVLALRPRPVDEDDARLEADSDRGRLPLRAQQRLAVGDARCRPRSPISRSSARPRCSFRSSSRTSCTASAGDLGLVFAAGGVGAVGAAL